MSKWEPDLTLPLREQLRWCEMIGNRHSEQMEAFLAFSKRHGRLIEENAKLMQATYIGLASFPILYLRAALHAWELYLKNDPKWKDPIIPD